MAIHQGLVGHWCGRRSREGRVYTQTENTLMYWEYLFSITPFLIEEKRDKNKRNLGFFVKYKHKQIFTCLCKLQMKQGRGWNTSHSVCCTQKCTSISKHHPNGKQRLGNEAFMIWCSFAACGHEQGIICFIFIVTIINIAAMYLKFHTAETRHFSFAAVSWS